MPSLKFNLIYSILRLTGMRKKIAAEMIDPPPRNRDWLRFSKRVLKGARTEVFEMDGRLTSTIIPKNQISDLHIIFYHGGAYVNEPSALLAQFYPDLANNLGLRVSVVDYPLAPENTYKETHDWVLKNYLELTSRVKGEIILGGDSAGGGLALAFAQVIRDKNITPKPAKLLLISPWVDLEDHQSLSPKVVNKDILLDPDAIELAAIAYSNGEDRNLPILSPTYGDLSNLGDIALWFGTDEMFYRQLTAFVAKAKNRNVNIIDYVGDKQQHNFVTVSSSERRQFIKEAKSFLDIN